MTAQDVLYQVAFNNEICLFVIPNEVRNLKFRGSNDL
jgi:hypothetical protein